MLKIILNNNKKGNANNITSGIKNLIVNNSYSYNKNYLFLKSYGNDLTQNNYSTASILKNTKRKSSMNRKIKVNHISKSDMQEAMEFQYKYSGLIKRRNVGRSDQAAVLKEEFKMDDEEIDDILDDTPAKKGDRFDDDDDDYAQTPNNRKVYYSEKITYSTDTSKDSEFIKRSLGNSSFSDKLDGNEEWVELDMKKDFNDDDGPKIQDLKKKELSKKGLEERNGNYFSDDYLITSDYESYFLTPDAPNNRKEKNLFRKLDELKEAKNQTKTKRGFKVNHNPNDQFVGQTIVQSRMASRILEVLNESPLFSPVSFLNSNIAESEFNFESDTDFDNNLQMLAAQQSIGSQVGNSGNFNINSDDLQVDKEDPILSKADIVLTHAEMSSDLRWVKLYWKRREHSNINGNENKHKSIDDFAKQDALYNIKKVKNENIKSILDSLGTNSAKQLVYDSFKPIMKEEENEIISSSKFGSKVSTNLKYQEDEQQPKQNNTFGFKNSFSIPNKKLELKISIKESNMKLLEQEEQEKKEKLEKREKLILSLLSNNQVGGENNSSFNLDSYNSGDNSGDNSIEYNNGIENDPLLLQLKGNKNEINDIINDNNSKNSNNIDEKEEEKDDKKKTKKSKEDIEIRRNKKIRTLFYEITDKDISHRLLKLKSRIRWIIGKRVQAKFVPDILFIKDEDEIKDETTIDILDNLVPIEFTQLFVDRVKSIEKTRNKLKNKYSSLFYDNNSIETNEDDLLDDMEEDYNKDEEVDLYQVLATFPSLRHEKIVQKFLKYERENIQKEKSTTQEEDLNLQIQTPPQEQQKVEENDKTNVQEIFKQFNKDL
ncbi:hypothetical protein DICPUDRAFT_98524 [Dictyostelium purpureum]|uniref:Uncharacterized protein n=1 Tax=Dictyostelium purpureum TaxID=5786 RepID=F0ZR68_DICPU|nr:uncharacterized protein DICPUDRAFT_98524 [Dictyostelium purpureum]EGC33566.1 hypothetical protein DICPUDRAFT_98524 [Dictyostelium purpureum]|eukprot:XP_003289915.1 hypothetical protein DICPUDRAFT_98524 [Dictyostelium purpureum]